MGDAPAAYVVRAIAGGTHVAAASLASGAASALARSRSEAWRGGAAGREVACHLASVCTGAAFGCVVVGTRPEPVAARLAMELFGCGSSVLSAACAVDGARAAAPGRRRVGAGWAAAFLALIHLVGAFSLGGSSGLEALCVARVAAILGALRCAAAAASPVAPGAPAAGTLVHVHAASVPAHAGGLALAVKDGGIAGVVFFGDSLERGAGPEGKAPRAGPPAADSDDGGGGGGA